LVIAQQNSERNELRAKTPPKTSSISIKKTSQITNAKVDKLTSRVLEEVNQETNNRKNLKRASDLYDYQSDESSNSSSQNKSDELIKRRCEGLRSASVKKHDFTPKLNNNGNKKVKFLKNIYKII
jgi:hypothetical protein